LAAARADVAAARARVAAAMNFLGKGCSTPIHSRFTLRLGGARKGGGRADTVNFLGFLKPGTVESKGQNGMAVSEIATDSIVHVIPSGSHTARSLAMALSGFWMKAFRSRIS